MEQTTQALIIPQTNPAGTFSVKIQNTTYMVEICFNQTAKDALEGKMKL